MSDYTQITSFGPKDALTTGDPNKRIRGSQLDPEFSAIATAIQSKFDSVDIASNTEAAALTGDSKLITPGKLAHALQNGTLTLGSGISLEGTATFPNVEGVVTATHTELNLLTGVTATAAQINTLGPTAYKPSNTDRASTTTLADDPHLTVSLEASSVYSVEVFMRVSLNTTGTGGFKYGFALPSGATGDFRGHGSESVGSQYHSTIENSNSANINFGNSASRMFVTVEGQVTTTDAGTFALRWAQVGADAVPTTVLAGAWLKVRKIA